MSKPDTRYIVEMNTAELAVRMCEASYGLTRPVADPVEVLESMDDDVRNGWLRAANAALEYLSECVDQGQRMH